MRFLFLAIVAAFLCGHLLSPMSAPWLTGAFTDSPAEPLNWLKAVLTAVILFILAQAVRTTSPVPRVRRITLFAMPVFLFWGILSRDNWLMHWEWPVLDSVLEVILAGLVRRIAGLPTHLQGLLAGVIIGDKSALAYPVQRMFRDFGIIHLLCISGFHVSLFGGFLGVVLKVPVTLIYAVRLCSHGFKETAIKLTQLLTVLVCCLYGRMIDFPPGAQRAILLLVCHTLIEFKALKDGRTTLYTLAFALQILLFPIDVLTVASLLSWSCYLIVVDSARTLAQARQSVKSSLRSAFTAMLRSVGMIGVMQLRILSTCGVMIGVVTPAAVIANVLVMPIFPYFVLIGFYVLLFQDGALSNWLLEHFTWLYGNMTRMGEFTQKSSWLNVPLLQLNLLGQLALVSIFFQTFLSIYTKLSIREKEC